MILLLSESGIYSELENVLSRKKQNVVPGFLTIFFEICFLMDWKYLIFCAVRINEPQLKKSYLMHEETKSKRSVGV